MIKLNAYVDYKVIKKKKHKLMILITDYYNFMCYKNMKS